MPRHESPPEVFAVIGKDTAVGVAHLLAQALGCELRCGLVSPLGCGFPGALTAPAQEDDLGETLATLHRQGARAAVVQPGSHRTWLADALAIGPTHGVLTGPHAPGDTLDSMLESPGLEWLVVSGNDPIDRAALRRLGSRVRIATVGGPRPAPDDQWLWVRAARIEQLASGLRVEIESNLGGGTLAVPLLGAAQGSQLPWVLAVMLSRGLPLQRALRELHRVRGVPGRMEMFGGNGAPLVVVDHAHQPDALEEALTDLRRHGVRRVITVVGCDGDRDRGQRPRMGAVALRLSDALILTDNNPRGEDGAAIIADILGGLPQPDSVRIERQRGLAIRRAIALAGMGDAVLVAGKGHENTQDMGELKVHFSDRAQVVEALREWREGHH
jgi:UDP-N-acetylmuramoyl-L-alanyl-D-glutamate--2,6-diaminopimelate ligase